MQRPAKTHAATLNDDGNIRLSSLIAFIRKAQAELEEMGEEDSAIRFEIFADWLTDDYKPGTPFKFDFKALGL